MRISVLPFLLLSAAAFAQSEKPLLWEISSLTAQGDTLYVALYGSRSTIDEGRSQTLLIAKRSPSSQWERIALPEKLAGESIRGALALKDEVYLLSQALRGDAEEIAIHRYVPSTNRWELGERATKCVAPLRMEARGKSLAVDCGPGISAKVFLKSPVVKAVTLRLPVLEVKTSTGTYRYDEVSDRLLRVKGRKTETIASPAELARDSKTP